MPLLQVPDLLQLLHGRVQNVEAVMQEAVQKQLMFLRLVQACMH
jgi:hypothetical protein